MTLSDEGAGLAGFGTALILAFGCSSNPTPLAPAIGPERVYSLHVLGPGGYAVSNAALEARTDDSTYRATTDGQGAATIRILNERALPPHLLFTMNSFATTPSAVTARTEAGAELDVPVLCDGRPGTISVRAPSLVRLGDALDDGGTPNEFQVRPDGVQLDIPFSLTSIPTRMPAYRLSVRGLEALVELRLNGHLVGRLRPPADVNALGAQADTLIGTPINVFLLTQNVLTIKTVGLASNPANLDELELGAVLVYLP